MKEAADFLVNALDKFSKAGITVYEGGTNSPSFEATKPSSSPLPRIDLPKFSEEFFKWESFHNTFRALIGSNDTITLKFHYLKSLAVLPRNLSIIC